jgi:flagellar basal-body rod modification protein FlgD
MSNISSVAAATNTPPTSASQTPGSSQTLNQADFLKLLVTQMTEQDPLSPESNTDMAAQMAQFSALQAQQNTEQDIQGLQAINLIGSTVSLTTSGGAAGSGVVSAVQVQAGTPSVVVNGQTYALSQISGITQTPTTTPTTN